MYKLSTYVCIIYTYMQLYSCLQPLMLPLTHRGVLNVIDRICADYDNTMKQWQNKTPVDEQQTLPCGSTLQVYNCSIQTVLHI